MESRCPLPGPANTGLPTLTPCSFNRRWKHANITRGPPPPSALPRPPLKKDLSHGHSRDSRGCFLESDLRGSASTRPQAVMFAACKFSPTCHYTAAGPRLSFPHPLLLVCLRLAPPSSFRFSFLLLLYPSLCCCCFFSLPVFKLFVLFLF